MSCLELLSALRVRLPGGSRAACLRLINPQIACTLMLGSSLFVATWQNIPLSVAVSEPARRIRHRIALMVNEGHFIWSACIMHRLSGTHRNSIGFPMNQLVRSDSDLIRCAEVPEVFSSLLLKRFVPPPLDSPPV